MIILKNMKKILNLITTSALFLTSYVSVYAAPPKFDQLGSVLDGVFSQILPIGGLLATGMLVYGGYMWLISRGDPGALKQAQGTITWAVIGLVFLFIFSSILKLVFDYLGN